MIKTLKLTNGKNAKLRAHQIEAVQKLSKHYKSGKSRASIFHCCRSGKSLTSVALHKQVKSKASIVFVPSISLISQTISDWKPNLPRARFLVVCGDRSAHIGQVTTSPAKIREFIREFKNEEIVIFCTYLSSGRICNALSKLEDFKFDLMIADEAHRSAGVDLKSAKYIHFDDCINATNRLYMTATARHISNRVLEYTHEDSQKVCMSDTSIFGEEVHSYTIHEGIENAGILSDYQIVAQGISCDLTKRAIEDDTNPNHLHISETAKLKCLHKALTKWKREHPLTHCISFHNTIDKAKNFAKKFKARGWKTFHINSEMNAEDRKNVIEEFQKCKKGLLTNCKCLTEGVNIVKCDCVFFSDTKHSTVDIVQSASRPLTLDPNKPKGFKSAIIIPTLHGKNDGIDDILSRHSHKTLMNVINNLKESDNRLVAFINSLRDGGNVDPKDPENIILVDGFEKFDKKVFMTLIPSNRKGFTDEEIAEAWIMHKGDRLKIANELNVRKFTLAHWLAHARPALKALIPQKYWDKNTKYDISKEQVEKALEECNGIRKQACKIVVCSRTGRVGVSASQFTNLVKKYDLDKMGHETARTEKLQSLDAKKILAQVKKMGRKSGGLLGIANHYGFNKRRFQDHLGELGIAEQVNEAFGIFSDYRILEIFKENSGIMKETTKAMNVSSSYVKRRRASSSWLDSKIKKYLLEEYGDENYNPSRSKGKNLNKNRVTDQEIVDLFDKLKDPKLVANELNMTTKSMYNWYRGVQRAELWEMLSQDHKESIRRLFPKSAARS